MHNCLFIGGLQGSADLQAGWLAGLPTSQDGLRRIAMNCCRGERLIEALQRVVTASWGCWNVAWLAGRGWAWLGGAERLDGIVFHTVDAWRGRQIVTRSMLDEVAS